MSRVDTDQTALLQAILDTSVAAVCVLDPAGQIVFANRTAEEILGLRASEIVKLKYNAPEWKATDLDGGPWPDESHPFSRVMRTGQPVFDVRHAIEWPDGRRKLLSFNGAPIKNERGEITRLVFSVIDITERIRVEREQHESSEWLRLALESAQMGMWSWEVDTDRVRWSEEVAGLFGLAVGQFGGTLSDYLDLVHRDDRELVDGLIRSKLASGAESYSIEHRLIPAEGEVHWIEGRGRIFRDATGTPTRIMGSVMDITARKTAELALRQSEEALRSVLQTVPGYVVSIARDHTIQLLNRTLPHLEIADVIGEDVVGFLAEECRDEYREALDRAFETGELQEIEALALWPDGNSYPFLIRIGPQMSGGTVESVTSVGLDISRLKETEKALRASQEQLRQAQRLESIGRLAGGVAHDFNNLLTVIIGCADMLLAYLQDRPYERPLVTQIRTAADRGAELTRQLLSFARQQVVHPRVIDLNELIPGARELLGRLIGEDIELTTDLAGDLGSVEVDPGQFEQVLVNLVVNARDAMPDGGRLTIRSSNMVSDAPAAEPDPRPGREWVVVTVSDTGTGMDAETLRLAFEPFFTTKERGKGTGLGLSTCFGIVRQAGGHIDAESTPGEGTCFRILLPRAAAPAGEQTTRSPEPDSRKGTETILLVEDDPMVRDVTKAILEQSGYRLIEAADGVEALRIFEAGEHEVELLITDVVMPRMGGPELADQLLSRRPELKVLFVSGYSPDLGPLGDLVGRGIELVQKPFSGRVLSAKVREILERR